MATCLLSRVPAAFVVLALIALTTSGCQTSTFAQHYFAAVDLDSGRPTLQLYRVTVNAKSTLVTSSYHAGFFDAEALQELFGVVAKAPDGARAQGGSSTPRQQLLKVSPATGRWEVVKSNERFTVVYGTNADALAQQIQTFADSGQAGDEIARLLSAAVGGSTAAGAVAAEQSLATSRLRSADLVKKLRDVASKLDSAKPQDEARKKLLEALQQALISVGSAAVLDTANLDTGFTQGEGAYKALAK